MSHSRLVTIEAPPDARTRIPSRRKLRLGVELALLAVASLELAASGSLRLLSLAGIEYRTPQALLGAAQRRQIEHFIARQDALYQCHDPLLGWSNRAGGRFSFYTQNHSAMRATHEYATKPPPGRLRIAAFGDSFVHGDEVADTDVWSARMEDRSTHLDVLNFGVSGYGVDQALLRYERDGRAFHPDVVLIGFFPDDLSRDVNVFRPFLAPGTGHQMTKPRFVLDDGTLRLVPNPLPDLDAYRRLLADPDAVLAASARWDEYFPRGYRSGPLDFLAVTRLTKLVAAQMLREDRMPQLTREGVFERRSDAYALTLALLRRFAEAAAGEQSLALVTLLPGHGDLERRRAGLVTTYAPLEEDLRTRGYWVLDLADAFDRWESTPLAALFEQVHYSALGNEIVADALLSLLDPLIPR